MHCGSVCGFWAERPHRISRDIVSKDYIRYRKEGNVRLSPINATDHLKCANLEYIKNGNVFAHN